MGLCCAWASAAFADCARAEATSRNPAQVSKGCANSVADSLAQTSVVTMPYSAPAQQLGSVTEAVGYARNTVQGRALYCAVGLQAPSGVG